MDKNKKKYMIITCVFAILLLIGGSYAFFSYAKSGTKNYELVAGSVFLEYVDGTDTVSLTTVFPETKEEARSRTDNVVTFTIKGKNTTENKDIWYEILLFNGSEMAGKTRFNDNDLVFDLIEIDENGNEKYVVEASRYSSINNRRIWINKINRNTQEEITKTYKLRVWLSDSVLISDNTEKNPDYSTSVFENSYATVRVGVQGDLNEKSWN